MRLPPVALLCLAACAGSRSARETPSEGYVRALREEHRALGRSRAMLTWYESTEGAQPTGQVSYLGSDPFVRGSALDALERAAQEPGRSANDVLALRFLRRTLTGELVSIATAGFDDELSRAELSSTAVIDGRSVAYRSLPNAIAAEPDAGRRAQLDAAQSAIIEQRLNPILARREEAAQKAAHRTGFPDYVALAEDLRGVRMATLLEEGVRYVQATDLLFASLLDRIAREELGIPREALHLADLARLWKAPLLSPHFTRALEVKALLNFLSGIGLDLRTTAGTSVLIDDKIGVMKRPRAFVDPVDAPSDVRISVKLEGGLDDYWTLFHEAGHAVHFANATATPKELVTLGNGAPSEAFGEFFRQAFAEESWLLRYRAFLVSKGETAPTNAELAAVLRRTALVEMLYLRRYAFAKIAYELRLHGRPELEIAPALALLPPRPQAQQSAMALRELYRDLFSRAYGFRLTESEAARFRTDVDDTFAASDYARAFAVAGAMHEAMRQRFGPDWYGDKQVGAFLRRELFAPGESLTAEQVLERLGRAPKVDFALSARRAARLVREADALEMRE